jgi:hypothetical protein
MSVNVHLSRQIGIPVFYPTSSYSSVPLTGGERTTLETTLDHMYRTLARQAPTVAQDFQSHRQFYLTVAEIAKAKFQQAPNFPSSSASELLSAEVPSAGQIGMQFIIPEDIARNQAGGAPTAPSTWDSGALTAGTPFFFIGSSSPTTGFFSTNGVEPNRYILAVQRNGLVEVGGNTPAFDQINYTTAQSQYTPFSESELFQITTEPTKQVYVYNTAGALILDETIQSKLIGMPKYSVNSRVALVGVKFFEYNYLSHIASATGQGMAF